MSAHLWSACLSGLLCVSASAQASGDIAFRQNLGETLPMQAHFKDADGRATNLGDYFGDAPVIVVFGYYRCPRLCSTLMDGVLQATWDVGLPHEVVGIGIDPRETPGDAARKLSTYRAAGHPRAATLQLLTGDRQQIAQVARAAGFQYAYDANTDQYAHPAGFLIATPEGRVSRYFFGLRFDRRDIRLALIEASNRRVGSFAEQLLLLCSHYDPLTGRYSVAVMALVRAVGALALVLLGIGIALARRRATVQTRNAAGRVP